MAAEVNKPDFSYVWASGGAIVAPSDVKKQTGWTAEVPPFQWENWSQNRQDNAILHLFQKGISEWDVASNYYFTASGVRSYVQGSDGKIYVAVADSVGQNPVTDTTDTYWKLAFASPDLATTTLAGIVELATNAEMATGTDATRVPSVAAVMSLFSKRVFTTTDFIRIPDVPGGLLIQWGSVVTGASGITATFATPFGTVLNVVTNALQTVDVNTTHQAPTNSTVFVQAYNQAGALVSGTNIRYFAVGVSP
jgi:hypothetical protein